MYGYVGQDSTESTVVLKIRCFGDCDYVHTVNHFITDNSPRLDGKCPKCGKEFSIKVRHINKDRIISRKVEQV
ncbi:hypothetical protein [Bacillus thuringiensis]|uniref:hypothetical protein n=1 Tax=Bacillus thuringiensis TaxID=1428 RepID=UPI000BFDC894|nr:hypothetical protein [Bacillus thuringiensis]PGT89926.1 hypothetical protein COD17_09250 [Bacillus thuringiensis]